MDWNVVVKGIIIWGLAFLTAKLYFRKKPETKTYQLILSVILFAMVYAVILAVGTEVLRF